MLGPATMKPDSDAYSPSVSEPQDAQLCAGCLHRNVESAHFCAQCGAPMTSYAATGPFESIWAEGHMYRSAVEKPRKLVVVLGVWMLGLTAAASGCSLMKGALDDNGLVAWGGVLFGAGIIAWALLLIAKTTRNYRVVRKLPTACES